MLPILQVIETLKKEIDPNVEKILDLGCGSFYNKSIDLFKKRDILFTVFNNKTITALDAFEKDINWRKEHGPKGNYICMNILDYNIEDYYDVVICHHVLEHLSQQEHDIMFDRIDNAKCRYIILGGPIGLSDNSTVQEMKDNIYEEHKIGLDPKFYSDCGYTIFSHGISFLAIKEN